MNVLRRTVRRLLDLSTGRHFHIIPPGGPETARAQALADKRLQMEWRRRVDANLYRRGLKTPPTVYRADGGVPPFLEAEQPMLLRQQWD